MSDIAETMRQQVATMVFDGSSEKEILQHYKVLYGERILMVPDGALGQTLSAVPVAAFALASGFLFLLLKKVHVRKRLVALHDSESNDSPARRALRERIRMDLEW